MLFDSFGKPGRSCYHNREWALKMIDIGLHPSSTGMPGGKITGQHISDYPIEGGPFIKACHSLVEQHAFRIPWIYRLSLPKGVITEPLAEDNLVNDFGDISTEESELLPDNPIET